MGEAPRSGGAAAELVVDAAGLMALGGDDVQTAEAHHFVMSGVGERLVGGVELVRGHRQLRADSSPAK